MQAVEQNDKAIFEGYLTGGATLLVSAVLILLDALHPLIILPIYLLGVACISASALWQLAGEETIVNWLSKRPIRFFGLGFLEVFFIVFYLDFFYLDHFGDVLVEAHGLIFDLIVFGIFFAAYDFYRNLIQEKRTKEKNREALIQRYKEEIYDFLGWDEKEATYRIVGNIKRLNRLGVKKINLTRAYLKEANLRNVDLTGASLTGANLESAELSGAILNGAFLQMVNMNNAVLWCAKLQEVLLTGASLDGAYLREADLRGADLNKSSLEGVDLWGANLEMTKLHSVSLKNAELLSASLKGTNLWDVDLEGAKLINTNLREANLCNANLVGVDFTNASLEKAKAFESQKEELSKVMSDDQLNSIIWLDGKVKHVENEKS